MGAVCTKSQSVRDPAEMPPSHGAPNGDAPPPETAKKAWADGEEPAEGSAPTAGQPAPEPAPDDDEDGSPAADAGADDAPAPAPEQGAADAQADQTETAANADERPVGPGTGAAIDDEEHVEVQLKECPYCKRKFAVERIEKHMKVCLSKEGTTKERRVFESARQRIDDIDDRKLTVHVRLEGAEAQTVELEDGTLKELEAKVLEMAGKEEGSDIYLYVTNRSGQIPLTSEKQLFFGALVDVTFSMLGPSVMLGGDRGGGGGGLAPLKAPASLAPLRGAPLPPAGDKPKRKKKKKKKSSRMKKIRAEAMKKERERESAKWDLDIKVKERSGPAPGDDED